MVFVNKTSIIDSVEKLNAKLKQVRKAQEEYAKFSQDKVDKIFFKGE